MAGTWRSFQHKQSGPQACFSLQDQLGDTFNHQPGLYVMHSAVLSTSVFSIRSLGKASLVSTALLNISCKLRGASSGKGLARASGEGSNPPVRVLKLRC
jgi:hypothetical protein